MKGDFPEWCDLDFLQKTLFKGLNEYKKFNYSDFLAVLTVEQKLEA